jgi:hypothetical protein
MIEFSGGPTIQVDPDAAKVNFRVGDAASPDDGKLVCSATSGGKGGDVLVEIALTAPERAAFLPLLRKCAKAALVAGGGIDVP